MIPQAAIDAAKDYEHLTVGIDLDNGCWEIKTLPRALNEPMSVVESGFKTHDEAERAFPRIRAEKVLEAAERAVEV